MATDTRTLSTPLGEIVGIDAGSTVEFRGIRFAEAPTGDRRFRPPVAAGAWSGTHDGTTYGNRSIQGPTPDALGGPAPGELSEDCLFLNVTAPAGALDDDADPRPVFCWIHGGAFTIGTGNEYPARDFAARHDVVVVSINYRLGLLGFLDVSGLDESYAGSANNGIADQICALEWIRDNIAAFGGDPDAVTIAGESAGALSVMALLASPAADGLYARAMANSTGGFKPAPVDVCGIIDGAVPGDGPLLDRLLAASPDELLRAQALAGFGLGSTVDGTVVTRTQEEGARHRAAAGIPLVIGSNGDEGTLFHAIAGFDEGLFDLMTSALPSAVSGLADPTPYLEALAAAHPDDSVTARNLRVWNQFFRRPAVDMTAAATDAGGRAWSYLFTMPTTKFDGALGAAHASEIAFTFGWLLDGAGAAGWTFHDAGGTTAEICAAWTDAVGRFVRTGDPNGGTLPDWPTYGVDDRSVLVIDDPITVAVDPDEVARKVWTQV